MTERSLTDAAAWGFPATLPGTLGITRLADISGLDCAGIPVVQAVRPLSKSNAVSQGKGATLRDAVISAVMESAESYFAERLERFAVTVASAESLGISAGLFDNFADPAVASKWQDWDLAWVEASSLFDGATILVPLELVHTAYVVPPPDYDGVFLTSTTGLAVSTSRAQALRHGLLECIERDAIARAMGRHGFLHDRRIDPYTVQSPELQALVKMLRERGIVTGLWLAPAAGGLPAVWCHVMEDCEADQAILPNPAEGSAARFNVADAAIAAIHEACQSRLAAISGARDDIGPGSFRNLGDRARRDAHRRLLAEGRGTVDPRDMAMAPDVDASAQIDWLLWRLRKEGISAAFAMTLDTGPIAGLHAVKIIVPELLPLVDG